MENLKLFVWENVLCDYTCGVMFALAKDVESAREMLSGGEYENLIPIDEINEEPIVYTHPMAIAVVGGG